MSDEPRRQVLRHETDARHHRAEEYPWMGHGLDAVMKGFRALIDGKPIPPETVAWVESCEAVKARFPKPATPTPAEPPPPKD